MEIGVVLPLAEYPWKQPSYSEIRALALSAEDSGFDSVWVFDHLLFRGAPGEPTEGIWESWTILSALAEATERVRLGTLVLCTAFRNPAVLAKMAVTLDEVSGGRLILGLGSGWHEPEFEAFGVPFENRVSRFEESLHVITSLLRTGTLDFEGRHIRIRGGELRPRGSPRLWPADPGGGLPAEDAAPGRPPRRHVEHLLAGWAVDPGRLAGARERGMRRGGTGPGLAGHHRGRERRPRRLTRRPAR